MHTMRKKNTIHQSGTAVSRWTTKYVGARMSKPSSKWGPSEPGAEIALCFEKKVCKPRFHPHPPFWNVQSGLTRKQSDYTGFSRKSSPFLPLRLHNFRRFRALRWNGFQPNFCFYCFEYGKMFCPVLNKGKLPHFLLDRVAKFTSFVSWTGSGLRWVAWTPLPKFLLSTTPGEISDRQSAIRLVDFLY